MSRGQEEIVGRALKDKVHYVSIETINKLIWNDKKQGSTLYHLRNQGKMYRKRDSSKYKRGQIVGIIGIESRPIEVKEKQRIGDLEIDLVIGKILQRSIINYHLQSDGYI
jgi:IS30 family transposase